MANPHLALFLSRATPLVRWQRLGLLARELALYRQLRPELSGFSIVTCGDATELDFQEAVPETTILWNRWGLPPNLYSAVAPWLHRNALRRATLFKSNQLDGAWTAVLAGRLLGRPTIVRAGYPWALNFRRQYGGGAKSWLIRRLESASVRGGRVLVVTTATLQAYFAQAYGVPPGHIRVIPNYVDTDRFQPRPATVPVPGRVVYVGRLTTIKNLDLLIQAVASVPDASLRLIGDGAERARLARLAADLGAPVTFTGVIPHEELPAELAAADLFVLPSAYEGHPKALLEAMACGCAVLGSDVEGIRTVIEHEQTGWLCPPTAADLGRAMGALLADAPRRRRLGQAARQAAVTRYGLAEIARLERQLYRQLQREAP